MAQGKPTLKSNEEIELIKKSCDIACEAIAEAVKWIEPGITGKFLDNKVEEYIRDLGAIPSFKGYPGNPPFPASICLSINEAVVHGIPTNNPLVDGDVISIDCGAFLNGYHGDVAYTVILGEPKNGSLELCLATKYSLDLGIQHAIHGKRIGDIGFAIQQYIEKEKRYGIVRELVGHGLGRELHEAPDIPNYGKRGNGMVLVEGMVIAIEPMVNLGTRQIKTVGDNWTVVSKDRKPSAHYEHTVVIRKEKAEILTNHSVIENVIKNNKFLREISPKI